jgi:hypothetical protein
MGWMIAHRAGMGYAVHDTIVADTDSVCKVVIVNHFLPVGKKILINRRLLGLKRHCVCERPFAPDRPEFGQLRGKALRQNRTCRNVAAFVLLQVIVQPGMSQEPAQMKLASASFWRRGRAKKSEHRDVHCGI